MDQARLATDLVTDSINMLASIEHVVAEYLVKSGIPLASLPMLMRATDDQTVDSFADEDAHERVKTS